ncbi:MAG: type II secretion system protein GspM [Ideonella sp.]
MATSQSPSVVSGPSRVQSLRLTLAARWRSLAPRERQAVLIAGAAMLVVLLWLVALQPALRTLREAPPQIAALEAELQSMRSLAAETGSLRGAAPVSRSQALAALESATRQLGSSGRLSVLGDRATLTLDSTDSAHLSQWLELARGAARARPIEMQLMRGPKGYSGTLVVIVGANP